MIKIKKDLELKGDEVNQLLAKKVINIDETIFVNTEKYRIDKDIYLDDNWLYLIKKQLNETGIINYLDFLMTLQTKFGIYFKYNGLNNYSEIKYLIFLKDKLIIDDCSMTYEHFYYFIISSCLDYIIENKIQANNENYKRI